MKLGFSKYNQKIYMHFNKSYLKKNQVFVIRFGK